MEVCFHSLDREGIKFFEDAGHPLTHKPDRTFGWTGEMSDVSLWNLVQLAFKKGLAVMVYRHEETTIFRIDSNKWHFRTH